MSFGIDLFWPAWAAGLFALAAGGAHVIAYRRTSKPVPGPLRWLLLEIRLVAVGLLLFALWRPAMEGEAALERKSRLALLVDTSKSMSIGDETSGSPPAPCSRLARAALVLSQHEALWDKVREAYEVSEYSFSRGLEALVSAGEGRTPGVSGLHPRGEVTALGDSLREASRLATAPEVVLVVSDGVSNSGLDPLDAAGPGGPPVYSISVGSAEPTESTRDVSVTGVFTSSDAFVSSEVPVLANVALTGLEGRPVKVVFKVDGKEAGSEEVTTNLRQTIEDVRFSFEPESAGPVRIEVEAQPLPDEIVVVNNAAATYVDVREGKMNVRYIEGGFRVESKFLRRALESAKDIEVGFVVARGPGDVAVEKAVSQEWDVLVVGDIPAIWISGQSFELIADAVSEKARGILFLGGHSAFGRGGWHRTPLAPFFPLAIEDDDRWWELPYRAVPESGGPYDSLVEITQDGSEAIWGLLAPVLSVSATGQSRPGASVLLVGEPVEREEVTGALRSDDSRGTVPILAVQEYGKGRTAAFTAEGTWQWVTGAGLSEGEARDASAEAHRRFWRQLVFWLARRKERGDITVNVTLPRHRVGLGESVEITAEVLDGDLVSVTDAELAAEITSAGVTVSRKFWLEGDSYRVDYEPPAAGDFLVKVTASRGGKEIAERESAFVVAGADIEFATLVGRPGLLEALSRATGGMQTSADGAPEVLAEISKRAATAQYVKLERNEFWSSWWYLGLIIALLTLEWGLRKANGLV